MNISILFIIYKAWKWIYLWKHGFFKEKKNEKKYFSDQLSGTISKWPCIELPIIPTLRIRLKVSPVDGKGRTNFQLFPVLWLSTTPLDACWLLLDVDGAEAKLRFCLGCVESSSNQSPLLPNNLLGPCHQSGLSNIRDSFFYKYTYIKDNLV